MNTIEFKIEEGVKFLVGFWILPTKKPALFHSIRVCNNLYNDGFSEKIIISGLLHDILEDTNCTYADIESQFGDEIADLVLANTKNSQVPKEDILKNMVETCAKNSESALIIKLYDVIDNWYYYQRTKNDREIQRCIVLLGLIAGAAQEHWYAHHIFNKTKNYV